VRRVLTAVEVLDRKLVLDPQVALRPEPFGALAYHYGNRRLVFLKHRDVVRVVRALGDHDTVADALRACDIAESRWPSFVAALESLLTSEVLGEPAFAG
jgi:mycofactocin biosynthesis protein MftB